MSLMLGWFGLVDAFCFAGGPVSNRGLVPGRGVARFRVVRFGGREVREARSSVADPLDGGDVFMHRDSSIAPLSDLRRRFQAVSDVLDGMSRTGVSLSRSQELTVQWERFLRIGLICIVTQVDLQSVVDRGLGEFRGVIEGLHGRVSDFISRVVYHRWDEAVRGWRSWIREDPLFYPCKWLRPVLVRLASPFLQCKPDFSPGVSGFLADTARIDEESRKAWLPFLCRYEQREASLEEFDVEVDGWLPLLHERSHPPTGGDLAEGLSSPLV